MPGSPTLRVQAPGTCHGPEAFFLTSRRILSIFPNCISHMRLPSRPYHLIWIGLTVGVFGLGLLATIAASNLQTRRLRAELAEVRRMMDRGRLAVAGKALSELAQRWPGQGEVLLLSGQCEEALGRTDRALAAWSRVPNSDPHFTLAVESRASLLINQGQFAPRRVVAVRGTGWRRRRRTGTRCCTRWRDCSGSKAGMPM